MKKDKTYWAGFTDGKILETPTFFRLPIYNTKKKALMFLSAFDVHPVRIVEVKRRKKNG